MSISSSAIFFLRKKEKHYASDVGLKNFYKADFDKNGYADLLISGKKQLKAKAVWHV